MREGGIFFFLFIANKNDEGGFFFFFWNKWFIQYSIKHIIRFVYYTKCWCIVHLTNTLLLRSWIFQLWIYTTCLFSQLIHFTVIWHVLVVPALGGKWHLACPLFNCFPCAVAKEGRCASVVSFIHMLSLMNNALEFRKPCPKGISNDCKEGWN